MSLSPQVQARIEAHLAAQPITLFMKGTPDFPQCGFSARTVEALRAAGASRFHAVNIFEDPEIRAQLVHFSQWPTFPQVFIKGELVGGCDITMELYQSGELHTMVADALAA